MKFQNEEIFAFPTTLDQPELVIELENCRFSSRSPRRTVLPGFLFHLEHFELPNSRNCVQNCKEND